jgi:predicted component of type VI protein secretion system
MCPIRRKERSSLIKDLEGGRMPEDEVLHDAERLRERAKQARAIAYKKKDSDTKQLLIALAENFERLAEFAPTKCTRQAKPRRHLLRCRVVGAELIGGAGNTEGAATAVFAPRM